VERLMIKSAMKEVGEKPNQIAAFLGITEPTVRNRIAKWRSK
jgi:DNA-binding Lrp family transcriptional regulator